MLLLLSFAITLVAPLSFFVFLSPLFSEAPFCSTMSSVPRPLKRQRSSQSDVAVASWDPVVSALVERLAGMRANAIATRDEHLMRAAEIDERISAKQAASRAVARVIPPPPSEDIEAFSRGVPVTEEVVQRPVAASPAVPAMKLLVEADPPEKLIHEQSIIVRAQAINRKNAELARERLPKQPEAQRNKTHWDYLLDEAVWLATDFREERKWKMQMAKRVSKMVMQYHVQKAQREARAKRDVQIRLVRIANGVAREVRKFWAQIGELADFRSSAVEEARVAVERETQLKFLLKQTEAYTTVLASSLQAPKHTSNGETGNGKATSLTTAVPETEVASALPLDGADKSTDRQQQEAPQPPCRSPRASSRLRKRARSIVKLDEHPTTTEDDSNVGFRLHADDGEDDEATMAADEAEEEHDPNELNKLEGEANLSVEELLRAQGIDPSKYAADTQQYLDSDDENSISSSAEAGRSEWVDSDGDVDMKPSSSSDVDVDVAKPASPAHVDMEVETPARTEAVEQEVGDAIQAPIQPDSQPGAVPLQTSSVVTAAGEDDVKPNSGKPDADTAQDKLTTAMTEYMTRGEPDVAGNEQDTEYAIGEMPCNAPETAVELVPSSSPATSPPAPSLITTSHAELKGIHENDNAHGAISPNGMKTSLPTPGLLRGSLRDYQQAGRDWLVTLYKQRLNGILADEMGLGKTIQTIALLAWLAVERGIWGPHLVVVPTSVMVNWEVEFKKWLPGFKVLTYFGSMKERRAKRQGWSKPNTFHVCITSYTLVVQDASALRRKKWVYLILDEAHNIKNFQSQRWQTLLSFPSRRRLLLTGTPLQNSVMELWSLMHFLMPDIFRSQAEFKDWFSKPLNKVAAAEGDVDVGQSEIVSNLHRVLRPFLLRRLKADVEKGLPPKHEHVVSCPLSKRQRQLYEDFMSRSDTQATLESGDFIGVMNVLMQLRKVCNHPDLFEGRPIVSPFAMRPVFYPVPSAVVGVFQMPPLSRIDLRLLSLDLATEEYAGSRGKWHANRIQSLSSAPDMIRELLKVRDEDFLAPMSVGREPTDAAILASKRAAAFRRTVLRHQALVNAMRVRQRAFLGEDLREAVAMTPLSLLEGIRMSRDAVGLGLMPSSTPSLVRDLDAVSERAAETVANFSCCLTRAAAPLVEMRFAGDDGYYRLEEEKTRRFAVSASPLRLMFRAAEVRSQVTLPDARLVQWDCGKLQILDGLLRKLQEKGSRALIFTQMTKVLDVLESFLNLYSYRYLRLDGATKTEDRQKIVERFNTDSRIFCMILTTRAGGVGLNLTGADTVIFYDTDYNPAVDAQAQDRAHRIGQTKPVHIYRLVSERTVEENILRRANEKRTLESLVISEAGFTTEAIGKQNDVLGLILPSRAAVASASNRVRGTPSAGTPSANSGVKNGVRDARPANGFDVALKSQPAVQTAHGPLVISGCIETIARPDPASAMKSGEYEEVNESLLAADDDRENLALVRAREEACLANAEFDDTASGPDAPTDAAALIDPGSAKDADNIESALTPIQRYALRLVELGRSDAEVSFDVKEMAEPVREADGQKVTWGTDFELSEMLKRREEDEVASEDFDDGVMVALEFQRDQPGLRQGHAEGSGLPSASQPGDEELDDDDPLFYELDKTEAGQSGYLKALTDADADIKLYLPLRDGGPEELKISSVVNGTAAAGLECAEDAAFFPHAYNRMSRTPYATKRQKEKAQANLKKRRAEMEARRQREKAADARKEASDAAVAAASASLSASAPNSSSRAGSAGERGKGIKNKLDMSSKAPAGPVQKKQKVQGSARNKMGAGGGSGGTNAIGAGSSEVAFSSTTGLFKPSTKKTTRKLSLPSAKASSSSAAGSMPGDGIGLNDGWTRLEDQKLIDTASAYNNNLLLVADFLALDPHVRAGHRHRRSLKHCMDRLVNGLQKDKNGPLQSRSTINDVDILQKHCVALGTAAKAIKAQAPNLMSRSSGSHEPHASHAKVVEEARSKEHGRISGSNPPTFTTVADAISVPSHHKAGYKPTETTAQALNRKRFPYIRPPRDDPRSLQHKSAVAGMPQRYGAASGSCPVRKGLPIVPSTGIASGSDVTKAPTLEKTQSSAAAGRRAASSSGTRPFVQPNGTSKVAAVPATVSGAQPGTRLSQLPTAKLSTTYSSVPGQGPGFVPHGTSARMSLGQFGSSRTTPVSTANAKPSGIASGTPTLDNKTAAAAARRLPTKKKTTTCLPKAGVAGDANVGLVGKSLAASSLAGQKGHPSRIVGGVNTTKAAAGTSRVVAAAPRCTDSTKPIPAGPAVPSVRPTNAHGIGSGAARAGAAAASAAAIATEAAANATAAASAASRAANAAESSQNTVASGKKSAANTSTKPPEPLP